MNEIKNTEEKFRCLIPDGDYEAQCLGYKEFKQFGGVKKLVLNWDFTLSGLQGIQLPQFFNMEHRTFKESSFYYIAWVIANNHIRPRRRTRQYMSPKIFENVVATVLVSTVKPKFLNGEFQPEIFHYSKVQQMLRLNIPNQRRQ